MSKVIATTTAFLLNLMAFAQVSESRTVAEFSKLKASQGIAVFYTVSTTNSIKVETDDNEKMKFIKTEVEGGILKIFIDTYSEDNSNNKRKKKNYNNNVNFKTLKVFVSGPSLQSIKASSSANIKMENTNSANQVDIAVSSSGSVSGKFNCNSISIDASSSGDFKGEVEAKTVAVETSSSADVDLNGKTIQLNIKSSSSSTCNTDKLLAEEVLATASSSADINVYASKSLEAKASSSADINYYGNPLQVNVEKSSSGSVNKR